MCRDAPRRLEVVDGDRNLNGAGPNGPLPKEIIEMYPNAPLIRRNGEVNAWDNPDFRKAVEATGRKQVILGGIVTEVCEQQAPPIRVYHGAF